ncbi:hypothetical protein QF038_004066 [Pseudarthrobacter sp. W1I19]|uniref:hypothetical protein n=1 Tax=Pseudarthrobacter sp. W1I19 TaxID=3042288 RepID=UPI002788192D|nr:hypothetical protein [Pseudarthrobacter sp. W1I19]MDQ0925558.1 hypothetical protein [Pseudarthrobacter sp. W1I19]
MTGARARSRGRVRRPAQPAAVGLRPDEAQEDYPAQDWSGIAVGSAVEVILPAVPAYRGRVDAKTPDSAIVWVVSLDGSGRQMHSNRDGISLDPAGA